LLILCQSKKIGYRCCHSISMFLAITTQLCGKTPAGYKD
jgi:hypothetical protein